MAKLQPFQDSLEVGVSLINTLRTWVEWLRDDSRPLLLVVWPFY